MLANPPEHERYHEPIERALVAKRLIDVCREMNDIARLLAPIWPDPATQPVEVETFRQGYLAADTLAHRLEKRLVFRPDGEEAD